MDEFRESCVHYLKDLAKNRYVWNGGLRKVNGHYEAIVESLVGGTRDVFEKILLKFHSDGGHFKEKVTKYSLADNIRIK